MNRIITLVLLCVLSDLLPASATGATIETVLVGNEATPTIRATAISSRQKHRIGAASVTPIASASPRRP